jgi:copper homeostasis protein (lipoprotein)
MSFRYLIVAVLLALSPLPGRSGAQQPSPTAKAPAHAAYALGTFVGNMPCADCPGITVKLILYSNGPNDFTKATYQMELVYQGKNVKPFVTYGNWSLLKGMPGNPQATIYELNAEKPGQEQYFLRLNADALKQLDRNLHEVNSPYNLALKRVANTK